ncbi:hypothetical protein AFK68_30155 [Hydrocoleum sp. CS-953]|nr:hypothetical protein AFK68_30155 [Hydrocoleum sp. CS-953]
MKKIFNSLFKASEFSLRLTDIVILNKTGTNFSFLERVLGKKSVSSLFEMTITDIVLRIKALDISKS